MSTHKWKKLITFSFIIVIIFLFSLPFLVQAQTKSLQEATGINEPLVFKAQVGIPNFINRGATTTLSSNSTVYIAQMVKAFYDYGVGIAGILAAIMLMAGGLIWLTSAGNSSRIEQAKNLIFGSIIGLVLLFGAWMMLKTINPNLVDFKIQTITMIEKVEIGCCEYRDASSATAKTLSSKECKEKNGKFYEANDQGMYISSGSRCSLISIDCNVKKDCDGNVEWCFDSDTKITTKYNCGNYFVPNMQILYELKDGRCMNQSECSGKIANCYGVADGERCAETGTGEELDGYCYYSMCYLGYGKEMESCGTQPGAYCSATRCSELGQVGTTYYSDNGSGRDCVSGLYCCYPVYE